MKPIESDQVCNLEAVLKPITQRLLTTCIYWIKTFVQLKSSDDKSFFFFLLFFHVWPRFCVEIIRRQRFHINERRNFWIEFNYSTKKSLQEEEGEKNRCFLLGFQLGFSRNLWNSTKHINPDVRTRNAFTSLHAFPCFVFLFGILYPFSHFFFGNSVLFFWSRTHLWLVWHGDCAFSSACHFPKFNFQLSLFIRCQWTDNIVGCARDIGETAAWVTIRSVFKFPSLDWQRMSFVLSLRSRLWHAQTRSINVDAFYQHPLGRINELE